MTGLHQRVAHHPLDASRHAQRVGQHHGRLDIAQLAHLSHPRQFAESITHTDGSRHLMAEDIALMRHNRRHTRAHVVALDQGHMAHRHTRHIGDGIIPSRGKNARREPPLTQRLVRLRGQHRQAHSHAQHHR